MGAAKKLIHKKVLRDLIPINALSPVHIEEISKKAAIEQVRSGRYVFKQGDRDNQSVYLLEGRIELIGDGRAVLGTVTAGSDAARHPLAHQQPRQLSARADGPVTVARVDSGLLDVLLTWDQSSGYDVVEIGAQGGDDDWMTRMLQSETFLRLPPSNIQQLLMRMEAVSARAGETVVRQGDEGDYFYIVKSGRLAVTRKASPRAREVLLAELGDGACFGEEALVSGTQRNATVTMITDGSLMRLSKADFDELLRAPLVQEVTYPEALGAVEQGAAWLDVRLPGEFENQAIKGSTNLPLSALRDQAEQLDPATRYIVCCDTGRRSASAAFVLSQRGFDAQVLRHGLAEVPADALTRPPHNPLDEPLAKQASAQADVIPFESDHAEAAAGERAAAQEHDEQVLAQARRRIDELQRQLAAQRSECQRLEQGVKEKQEAYQSVQKDLAALKQDFEGQRQALEQRLSEQQAEIDRLREADAGARQQHDTALEQLRTEKQHLQEELHAAEQRHLQQVKELERDLSATRDDYQQLGQRTSALGGERDALRAELEQQRLRLEAMQNEQRASEDEKDQRILELEGALKEREAVLDELQARQQALAEQLAAQTAQFESLQVRVDDEQRHQQELTGEVERLQQQLGSVERSAQALEQEKQTLAAELERVQAELVSTREADEGNISTLEQRSRALEAERDALGAQVGELEARLAQSADAQVGASEQVRTLETRLDAQRKELESDLQSARDALARAQNEQQNVLKEQARLSEALQVAEHEREQQQHGHENALRALREELEAAREDAVSAGEAAVAELERQLEQAQDSARQAEEQLLEANRAADQEMAARLEAEQAMQTELRAEIKALTAERNEVQEQLSQVQQQAGELEQALEAARQAARQAVETSDGEFKRQVQTLERERDALLEQLQQLRQQYDSATAAAEAAQREADQLRAEAEVSRGLIAMQGGGSEADPAIREELQQVRKDIEVAVRLRARAEQQAADLQAELDRLRAQHVAKAGRAGFGDSPLKVPSLDAADAEASAAMQTLTEEVFIDDVDVADPDPDEVSAAAAPAPPTGAGTAPATRRRLFGLLSLLLVGVVTGAAWWLTRSGPGGQAASNLDPAAQRQALAPDTPASATGKPPAAAPVGASAPTAAPATGAGTGAQAIHSPPVDEPGRAVLPEAPPAQTSAPVDGPLKTPPPQVEAEPVPPAQSPAPPLPRRFSDRLADGGRGPVLLALRADSFLMGSGPTSPRFEERPRHPVHLNGYAIGQYEVTFDEYDRFARASGRALPADEGWGRGRRPVVNVSWEDAQAYARWLSQQTGHPYRLPSEAEWEYAARGGTQTRFWWGNEADTVRANCFDCGSEWDAARSAPVGSFGANPLGLYDTAGNVMEWVEDCYRPDYEGAADDGAPFTGGPCESRVVRGGSFSSALESLRSAARAARTANTRLDNLGFRLVRER